MKKWYLIVIVCLSLLGGCSLQQSALIETAKNNKTASGDTAAAPGDTMSQNNNSSVDLTNANGVVQFRAVSGSYGSKFDMFYVTFFQEESPGNCPRCKQQFKPRSLLTFTNVAPGTYYVNFEWYETKRWVVENPRGNLVGAVEVRVGNGSWQRLSSQDITKPDGAHWNFKIVVR